MLQDGTTEHLGVPSKHPKRQAGPAVSAPGAGDRLEIARENGHMVRLASRSAAFIRSLCWRAARMRVAPRSRSPSAACRSIANSNVVGCSTGTSLTFSPLKTLASCRANCRNGASRSRRYCSVPPHKRAPHVQRVGRRGARCHDSSRLKWMLHPPTA